MHGWLNSLRLVLAKSVTCEYLINEANYGIAMGIQAF
jgi:hypothetical protein